MLAPRDTAADAVNPLHLHPHFNSHFNSGRDEDGVGVLCKVLCLNGCNGRLQGVQFYKTREDKVLGIRR